MFTGQVSVVSQIASPVFLACSTAVNRLQRGRPYVHTHTETHTNAQAHNTCALTYTLTYTHTPPHLHTPMQARSPLLCKVGVSEASVEITPARSLKIQGDIQHSTRSPVSQEKPSNLATVRPGVCELIPVASWKVFPPTHWCGWLPG